MKVSNADTLSNESLDMDMDSSEDNRSTVEYGGLHYFAFLDNERIHWKKLN